MSDKLESSDIAALFRVVAKIEENYLEFLDKKGAQNFKTIKTYAEKLSTKNDKDNGYEKMVKAAVALAKEGAAAAVDAKEKAKDKGKGGKEEAKEEENKNEFKLVEYEDDGDCDAIAKKLGGDVQSGYKRDKKKYYKDKGVIGSGELGCLYETNLTTKGSKYSLFFKYVRVGKTQEAKMVAVAIGTHSGSGNKYVVVKKDGTAGTTPISATKKL